MTLNLKKKKKDEIYRENGGKAKQKTKLLFNHSTQKWGPKTKIKEKSSRFWNSDFLTNPCDMDLPRYKMNLNKYSPTL